MPRKILGGLVAALLLAPAVSKTQMSSQQRVQQHGTSGDTTSSGTGMTFGNEPGHVASPSNTQVDTSTRGPLNDVQPGVPQSSDTSAAKNPAPSPVRR